MTLQPAWLSVTEANTYFETRIDGAEFWVTGLTKADEILLSQRDIELSSAFDFDDLLDGEDLIEANVTDELKAAVCEQILFRLKEPSAEKRMHLMSMGVRDTKVVGERWVKGVSAVTIAPRALPYLAAFRSGGESTIEWTR